MTARVLLDLNFPAFQDDLLAMDGNEVQLILKTLRKVRTLDWATVYRDPGLKWEQIKGAAGKFTIRLSRSCRAVVLSWSARTTTCASSPCMRTMTKPLERSDG